MDKQMEKAFQTDKQTQLETNDAVNEEKNEVTNLQHDAVNKSENPSENDKMSYDADETNSEQNNVSDEVQTEEGASREQNSLDDDVQTEKEVKEELSWEEKYAALNDTHLRLVAEFDNFRKRTIREKADLIKSGGASTLANLLPVVDDFERALNTLQVTEDVAAAVKGVNLIYDKFIGYLSQQGVKRIDAVGQPFDTDFFEAIATFPVTEEDRKGKVIDCIQTGYKLYDKVLRHAKVVVGE